MTRVSTLAAKSEYGIITNEILDEIFNRRIVAADLLSHSTGLREHHAGWAVREALISVRQQLEGLIR